MALLQVAETVGVVGVVAGKSDDPLETFKTLAKRIKEAHKDGITLAATKDYPQIEILPDTWKYDVKKNDSLVSPFIGKIIVYAKVKSKLISNPFANMRFHAVYIYQDNKWAYSSCKVEVKDTDDIWYGLDHTNWPHDIKGQSPLGHKLLDIDEIN